MELLADSIEAEVRVIDVAVWACEASNMPETARSLRLTMDNLRKLANILRTEARAEVKR